MTVCNIFFYRAAKISWFLLWCLGSKGLLSRGLRPAPTASTWVLPRIPSSPVQGTLNPYAGQQNLPIYGVSAAANASNQPFSQLGPSISGGGNGYLSVQGYNMPGNQYVQLTGSNFSNASPTARPSIQTPFLVAAPIPAHPHLIIPAHSPQFTQASVSDQRAS